MGGNGRERAVSFPKIILRPHFKKENLRLFGDGEKRRKSEKARHGEDELGMEVVAGRACFPGALWAEAAGERPAEWTGREGHVLPAWGGARTEPKTSRGADTSGARKPSSVLRGVYTVFCLQGEK